MKRKAIVIGAGAQGLSTAWKLLESGMFDVEIIFDKAGMMPPNALWDIPPYNVQPEALFTKWAKVSFSEYLALRTIYGDEAGINYPVPFYALTRGNLPGDHPRKNELVNYRRGKQVLQEEALQRATMGTAHKTYNDAEAFESLSIDTPKHFAWLRKQIQSLGGKFTRMELENVTQVCTLPGRGQVDLIVNCSGLGAYDLVGDQALHPIKGQVLHVPMDEVTCAVSDNDTRSYAIPGGLGQWLEVGGTAEEGNWNRVPNASVVNDVVKRASEMLPRLKDVVSEGDVWAGLRPGRRGGVRFGLDETGEAGLPIIIHCYGHGGAGIITSIGCAIDVTALAVEACRIIKSNL